MSNPERRNLLWRITAGIFEIVATIILLLDAIVRPVYRPLLAWMLSWQFVMRLEALIAPLPRFTILVLFAVPFAIAEPAKVFALYLIARGLVVTGVVLLVVSYLLTFLVVERIYHAGRDKLLTYGWFAWAMRHIIRVRSIATMIWRRVSRRARQMLDRLSSR